MCNRNRVPRRCLGSLLCLLVCLPTLVAQTPVAEEKTTEPLDLDQAEEVRVRLVLVDVIVLDSHDRTVPDLTRDDFEILVDGERREVDTLDVACADGGVADAVGVRNPMKRGTVSALGADRKIVLALDYLHLPRRERAEILDHAIRMMQTPAVPGEQIMVAALNGGLRIEEVFTEDRDRVRKTLKRMQYDITLWQPNFFHLTDEPFFSGMQALFTVLESVPGPKAIVLFSSHPGLTGAIEDLRFAELAAAASSARAAIYPVHGTGLVAKRPG